MSTQLDLFTNDESNQKFWEFHRENPNVYEKFKEYAFEAINSGRKTFSIDMIWGAMRWYSSLQTTDKVFKLNNNYRSFYGRLFVLDFPKYKDFFTFRVSKANSLLNKAA